jgi:glutamate--cysteine ligase
VGTACVATVVDTTVMAQRLALDGVALAGLGIDPGPLRPRLVRSARYDAMERFFDRRGVAGRTMMRSTAAMQLNLDCGDATTAALRWRRAHVLGPTLAATFANSPITDDLVTGWRSARLATWWAIDPTRTQPPPMEGDPVACWADYVLDAHVMLVRGGDSFVGLEDDITFAEWVTHGHELGYPDLADLDYHLTTLFPPVRARGWFELRMIDALPDPWWRAAAGVTTALLYDEHAGAAAEEAAAPTAGMWVDAARHGLSHPALARSAKRCFALALDALPRVGADPTTQTAALRYFERFVAAGRCPADEVLTAWTADRARPLTDAMVVT